MKRPGKLRLNLAKYWLPILASGFVFQNLGSCDPTVRDTVLTGVQTSLTGLITALFNAFFLSLSSGSSTSTTSQPVVQAVFDNLQKFLA